MSSQERPKGGSPSSRPPEDELAEMSTARMERISNVAATEPVAASSGPSDILERLGPFDLLRTLGAGAMGQVFEAVDTRTGQRVALKMLFDIDPTSVYRLKREFRRMADTVHENLVTLYELHNVNSTWFFTMELLSGVSLKAALQDAERCDFKGLRGLLRQLAHGVHALHRAGRIHRDLKPSNVLVTPEGRLVILDFGLVNEIDHRTLFASSRGLVHGTPAFMAPEQAAGQLTTPASDWYAVGVILFEALTGCYPFQGSVMEILLAKQFEEAPRVSSLALDIPQELDDLVTALLSRVPAERPGVTEILAWCSDNRAIPASAPKHSIASGGLLQREAQLATLREASRRIHSGVPVCVDIAGGSGTGKTDLVRHFVAELPDPKVVLESVCSQRESVPFRACDGLVDAVAGHLSRIPGFLCEALIHDLGGPLYALAQIFPVMARLPWIANQTPPTIHEPLELRRRAFSALKLLLFRIAERHPTVLIFDNLQWGDRDSAHLVEHLLAPPGVPPCLFLLVYRPAPHTAALSHLAHVRALMTPTYALCHIETPPLSPAAAVSLAQRLLAALPSPRRTRIAQKIAREAGGNPALIQVLAEEANRPGGDAELTLSGEGELLVRLVRSRIEGLSNEARELLGRIVVSRASLQLTELLKAGPWRGDILATLAQLQARGLIRTDSDGEKRQISPLNEPLQHAAMSVFDAALLRRSHRDLATALLGANTDQPERVAYHLHAAGLHEEAFEHATSAAYLATKALAFDRAAELYRLALQCKGGSWSVRKSAAEALVQAGRGAEAASLFLSAAESAPTTVVPRLLRLAAEQLLNHGDLARGVEILFPLLQDAGIELPKRARDLNAQLAAHTDRLLRRGFDMVERAEFELARRDLDRIDLCWTAGKGLMLNDPIQGSLFLTQGAKMALESGEPRRIARSLALCGLASRSRGLAEGSDMLVRAEGLADKIHDHYAFGLVRLCRGILLRLEGQWLAALSELDFGLQYLAEHCPGTIWESGLGQASTMVALEAQGELRVMSARVEELLRRAQETGDTHTSLLAGIYSALSLVAADQPAQARARVQTALARWSGAGFHVQHLHALKIEIYCDLYEGRPADAWLRILAVWPQLEGSDFLRIATRRTEALTLRAKAALAAMRADLTGHAHLSEIVSQDVHQLEREGKAHLNAEAALLRAGLLTCAGNRAAASRYLDVAISGFEQVGMNLNAAALRRLCARTPGSGTVTAAAHADALMRMQGIKDTDAWLRIVAPGLVD